MAIMNVVYANDTDKADVTRDWLDSTIQHLVALDAQEDLVLHSERSEDVTRMYTMSWIMHNDFGPGWKPELHLGDIRPVAEALNLQVHRAKRNDKDYPTVYWADYGDWYIFSLSAEKFEQEVK